MAKINQEKLDKITVAKDNIQRLKRAQEIYERQVYETLGIDSAEDGYQGDWIFDWLYNGGDTQECFRNAGFEINGT